MKRNRVISLHKCVFGVSVFCLLLPSVALSLRAGAFAGGPAVVAGLLSATAAVKILVKGLSMTGGALQKEIELVQTRGR